MSDDLIFREVEEDLRQERLKKLWDSFGLYIIGLAIVVVIGVAGYQGWQWYSDKRAGESGARLQAALSSVESGQDQDAIAELAQLADGGAGAYPIMARFASAGLQGRQGAVNEAVAEFDLIANAASDPEIANMARLRAAALLIDSLGPEAINQRIGHLNEPGNPWRHSARELLGLSAYQAQQYRQASEIFRLMLSDPQTPSGVRQRAEILLAVIAPREAATE